MKKHLILTTILICSVFIFSNNIFAQTNKEIFDPEVRAAESDTVWIIYNHVKADKRQQFEKFMKIYFQCLREVVDEGKFNDREVNALKCIRYLTPVRQNIDSTYTYVFMGDPWLGGLNTSIIYHFKKKYSDEEAKKYLQMFSECLASV